jgi:hypothetical protein
MIAAIILTLLLAVVVWPMGRGNRKRLPMK